MTNERTALAALVEALDNSDEPHLSAEVDGALHMARDVLAGSKAPELVVVKRVYHWTMFVFGLALGAAVGRIAWLSSCGGLS